MKMKVSECCALTLFERPRCSLSVTAAPAVGAGSKRWSSPLLQPRGVFHALAPGRGGASAREQTLLQKNATHSRPS